MRQGLEIPSLELKHCRTNWPIIGTYKPPSLNNTTFMSKIRKIVILSLIFWEKFNMTPNNPKLNKLLEDHNHCNLLSELSEPTSLKSINPTCTDNFLTDTKIRFTQNFDS